MTNTPLLALSSTAVTVWMALFGLALTTTFERTVAFHHDTAPAAVLVGRTAARRRTTPSSIRTPLHYSSSGNNNDDTAQNPRWWKNLLSSPPESAATATTAPSSTGGEASQQEMVDQYLDFLDRRYRRLHSDEEEERKRKQSESSSSNSKSIPFSAMDWLMNGSNAPSSEEQEQRKHEDALYVLGVAGLASQKLLQKHHLQTTQPPAPAIEGSTSPDDVIEVQAEADVEAATSVLPSHVFIQKVLVPMIRVIYIVQRRRDRIVHKINSKLGAIASAAAQRIVHPVARRVRQGPRAILDALLEIGGGKRNIALTLACAYTVVVLLRPILQSAVAEASVGP